MNQNYQLAGHLQTTGWNPSFDVNAMNGYGMTPAEVAMQAGNVDEFKAITSHADFQPEKLGRVGLFLDICRRNSESHYNAVRQALQENFKFAPSARTFVKLD